MNDLFVTEAAAEVIKAAAAAESGSIRYYHPDDVWVLRNVEGLVLAYVVETEEES